MNTQKKLITYIGSEIDYWDFYGVIRIIKKGRTLFETSRGYSNIEFGIKNNMRTRFTVGSVTKQFTAFSIMILYDKGLLAIDEKANRYLPTNMQIPSDITVHDLLTHTSGLYNYYNFEDDFYVYEDRMPYNKDMFFTKWINKKPVKQPGTEFNYNNSNYNLLAWIIENLSGQEYSEFVRKNIFDVLGMDNSEFDNGQNIITQKANNYMYDYGKLVRTPYTNNLFHIGAGALVTDSDDLQRWYECLREKEILSEQAYSMFFKENKNHYCYGLERCNKSGKIKYSHGGDYPGVSTYIQYFFDDDICIIILSNKESLNQYRFGGAIAEIMYGGEPKTSCRLREVPISYDELEKHSGTYLPGKIHIEVKDKKLYLVRVNHNVHIEVYHVGQNLFMRRYEEQQKPHILLPEGATKPQIWGYGLVSKQFI